jgi:hypothetical protein
MAFNGTALLYSVEVFTMVKKLILVFRETYNLESGDSMFLR